MPREKPLFRVNLDRLDAAYPGKEILSIRDVADYMGVSVKSVQRRKWYDKTVCGIPKTKLASLLS